MNQKVRIEIDADPVSPEVMRLVKVIRDSRDTTLENQILATAFISLAIKFNELLGKLEFGMASISDAPSERPTTDYIDNDLP